MLPDNPTILITRLSHIGDCLLTLPLAVRVKAHWPRAKVVWLTEAPCEPLLRHHPAIDEVLVVKRQWFHEWKNWRTIRKTLAPYNFDLAFDPQGLIKSSLAGFLSGAQLRFGFRGKHGREFSSWLNNRKIFPCESHLVDRTLELLALAKGSRAREPQATPNELALLVPDSAISVETKIFLDRLRDQSFFVINPGASWPSKLWCTQRFGQVAECVQKTLGILPIVTWFGDSESAMADSIVAESHGAALKAPMTSLVDLSWVLRQALFFLGCDTGPLHLAVASGTRCIGLYGPTLPSESGAYGDEHLAIQNVHRDGTRRQRRSADNSAMMAISVADVLESVRQIMSSQQSAAA